MELKKSHNDYWASLQLVWALQHGCDIIECDVIYTRGCIYLSHSWRPFGWLTFGKLIKYLIYLQHYETTKKLYLHIEIKTNNKKIIDMLVMLLLKYHNPKVVYLIEGLTGGWIRRNRAEIAQSIVTRLQDEIEIYNYATWRLDKSIASFDFYLTAPWYKRILFF